MPGGCYPGGPRWGQPQSQRLAAAALNLPLKLPDQSSPLQLSFVFDQSDPTSTACSFASNRSTYQALPKVEQGRIFLEPRGGSTDCDCRRVSVFLRLNGFIDTAIMLSTLCACFEYFSTSSRQQFKKEGSSRRKFRVRSEFWLNLDRDEARAAW